MGLPTPELQMIGLPTSLAIAAAGTKVDPELREDVEGFPREPAGVRRRVRQGTLAHSFLHSPCCGRTLFPLWIMNYWSASRTLLP